MSITAGLDARGDAYASKRGARNNDIAKYRRYFSGLKVTPEISDLRRERARRYSVPIPFNRVYERACTATLAPLVARGIELQFPVYERQPTARDRVRENSSRTVHG